MLFETIILNSKEFTDTIYIFSLKALSSYEFWILIHEYQTFEKNMNYITITDSKLKDTKLSVFKVSHKTEMSNFQHSIFKELENCAKFCSECLLNKLSLIQNKLHLY